MDSDSRLISLVLRNFHKAPVTNTPFLSDTKMRQRNYFRRTLLIEYLAAVPAVVLAVGERERGSAAKADIRVNPLWSSLSVYHR